MDILRKAIAYTYVHYTRCCHAIKSFKGSSRWALLTIIRRNFRKSEIENIFKKREKIVDKMSRKEIDDSL